jgi:hypothetical protein
MPLIVQPNFKHCLHVSFTLTSGGTADEGVTHSDNALRNKVLFMKLAKDG